MRQPPTDNASDPPTEGSFDKEHLEAIKLGLEIERLKSDLQSEGRRADLEIQKLEQETTPRYRLVTYWGGIAAAIGVLFSIIFSLFNTSQSIRESREVRLQQHEASISAAFTQLMSADDDSFVKGAMALIPAAPVEPVATFIPRLRSAISFRPVQLLRDDLRQQLTEDSETAGRNMVITKYGVEEPLSSGRVQLLMAVVAQLPSAFQGDLLSAIVANTSFGSERLRVIPRLVELFGDSVWSEQFEAGNSRARRVITTLLARNQAGPRVLGQWVQQQQGDRAYYALAVAGVMKREDGIKLAKDAITLKAPELRRQGYTALLAARAEPAELLTYARLALHDPDATVRGSALDLLRDARSDAKSENDLLRQALTDPDEQIVEMALFLVEYRRSASAPLIPVLERLKARKFKDVFMPSRIEQAIQAIGDQPTNDRWAN